MLRVRNALAFIDIFRMFVFCSWKIRALGVKLWLHISMSGSSIGMSFFLSLLRTSPCNLKAREDTADIAQPRDDEFTSWPAKGWSLGETLSSISFISLSNSRRKRHLLFTWNNVSMFTIYIEICMKSEWTENNYLIRKRMPDLMS